MFFSKKPLNVISQLSVDAVILSVKGLFIFSDLSLAARITRKQPTQLLRLADNNRIFGPERSDLRFQKMVHLVELMQLFNVINRKVVWLLNFHVVLILAISNGMALSHHVNDTYQIVNMIVLADW